MDIRPSSDPYGEPRPQRSKSNKIVLELHKYWSGSVTIELSAAKFKKCAKIDGGMRFAA